MTAQDTTPAALLTVPEVAALLKVSRRTVARLIRRAADGDPAGLPHIYPSPQAPRVAPAALAAWIDRRTIRPR